MCKRQKGNWGMSGVRGGFGLKAGQGQRRIGLNGEGV